MAFLFVRGRAVTRARPSVWLVSPERCVLRIAPRIGGGMLIVKSPLILRLTCTVAAVCFVTLGASSAPQDSVTVGWFVKEIAASRKLIAVTESDALAALRALEIQLPPLALERPLTESDVVAIGTAMGTRITSSQPASPVSRGQASTFLVAVSGGDEPSMPVSPSDTGGTPNPASDNGKGKKKGHNKSESEPL